ncbi:MAG: hypothetical protein ACYC7D_04140 [Nitrososphaerales archaeon]
MALPIIGIAIGVVVLVVAIVLVFPRYGPHYTSKLTCPKCNQTFDYNWVPGGSFTAIRLGRSRYMRCHLCGKWSTFNIFSTRVRQPEKEERK